MNKARITYRFERNDSRQKSQKDAKDRAVIIPLYQEEFKVVEDNNVNDEINGIMRSNENNEPKASNDRFDYQTLNQFTTDYGAWTSPFDSETEKLEKLIRESTNPRMESDSESHYDPETGFYKEHEPTAAPYSPWIEEPILKSRYKRHHYTPWFKIITSVTGAVVTGVVFGFIVLSMFSKDSGTTKTADDINVNPIAAQQTNSTDHTAGQQGEKDKAASQPASGDEGAVDVSIPAQTFYLLQNGVFASLEGAQTAQDYLQKQGLAAAGESGEKYIVYAGIASNRDDALLLSHQLQESNKTEIYIKSFEIPQITKLKWSGEKADDINAYFTKGNELVQMLSSMTFVHLQESKPTVFDEASIQTVKKEHQTWTGITEKVNVGMSETLKPLLQKMNNALNTAVVSIDEYNKNPSAAYLWQSQAALMNYIIKEKELLASIALQ